MPIRAIGNNPREENRNDNVILLNIIPFPELVRASKAYLLHPGELLVLLYLLNHLAEPLNMFRTSINEALRPTTILRPQNSPAIQVVRSPHPPGALQGINQKGAMSDKAIPNIYTQDFARPEGVGCPRV